MSNPSDTAREDLLFAMLADVPFEGWNSRTLQRAARACDLPDGAPALYFPGGALDVIRFWAEHCDRQAAETIKALDLSTLRIRDKVTQGVLARLEAIGEHEDAARRALSRLAMPDAAGQGLAQLWASADVIWRGIGDQSTDGNYYSKRTILSGVIGSTMLSWLSDHSDDKTAAKAFLDARIGNVMRFETAKFKFKSQAQYWPKPAEVLGRLRYGGYRKRRKY